MVLERLKADLIRYAISPKNLTRLAQLEIFEKMDSTNSYLLNQGKKGAASGTVCFAEQQTNGRGRLGRVWHSPESANIYCSLLWRFSKTVKDYSSIGISLAVMIARALKRYGIHQGITLKWPNDILYLNRKLAGILLEQTRYSGLVIGIGVNLAFPETDQAVNKTHWIDLAEATDKPIARNDFAGIMLDELLGGIPVYETQGLQPFLKEWEIMDALVGSEIAVQTPQTIIVGNMCGINEAGELLLQDETKKILKFSYGEVTVRVKNKE